MGMTDTRRPRIMSRQEMSASEPPTVILASKSAARAAILRNAGVRFTVHAAGIDEGKLKKSLRAKEANASIVAGTLAECKALHVSSGHEGALVIGADQVLDCEGNWFDKPVDLESARRDLVTLRDRTHLLVTSVCVVCNNVLIWRYTDQARLVMHAFSDGFLDAYLVSAGHAVLGCAGAYQLESLGVQLFKEIEGDYFSILGLPLLPLLGFMRSRGVIAQ